MECRRGIRGQGEVQVSQGLGSEGGERYLSVCPLVICKPEGAEELCPELLRAELPATLPCLLDLGVDFERQLLRTREMLKRNRVTGMFQTDACQQLCTVVAFVFFQSSNEYVDNAFNP